jgi:glycosyltransferase involved in cell wall biosynthesis
MRVGQNPAKSIDHVSLPQKVTVAIVVYIPFLSGYYTDSLEVLKACLESLWENTDLPYDLLVFDNASCAEVRAYLLEAHRQGRIQYLVLSDKNVGKGGAWNFIFQGAPGEVIAYADSDIYFYPGWLAHSLEILDAFPQVGMVTSRPIRTPETYYSASLEWARQTPDIILEKGQYLSWEVFKEHNDSLGVSEEQARQWFEESYEWRVQYKGTTVHLGAAHFQFLAPKAVLQSVMPIHMDRPMGQVRSLDQKLNELGYLRLTTSEPYVKHLGNWLSDQSPTVITTSSRKAKKTGKGFWSLPFVRSSMLWVYNQIFRLYFK